MEYRNIEENEITCDLFAHFNRHQVVTKCWRKIDGEWCIKDIAFVEEWTEEEYEYLVKCFKNTVKESIIPISSSTAIILYFL